MMILIIYITHFNHIYIYICIDYIRQQLMHSKELIEEATSSIKCPICCNDDVSYVLIPCGHTICEHCLGLMSSSRCPHCRSTIQNKVKFFLPGSSK